ncbi:MAG: flippase [Lachnospiraceae bacterium]|nr:flippase [Lachnospiraceae bacterium]
MSKEKIKEKSILKNIAYNMLSQIVALIVPLLTAPYIARVFNAELIGEYSYALANSSYFVLFECLGFALYGQIKVAANRDDVKKTSLLFFEIMLAKIILSLISIGIYVILIFHTDDILQKKLCIIMLINILANGLDVTWFLNGQEEFKKLAVRSVVVRLVNLISIYVFINSEKDLLLYAILMQGATFFSYLALYPVVVKYIVPIRLRDIRILPHIKASFIYFVPGLVTTIFSSTDKTMLGIMTNSYEVGVYEEAGKISQICMSAISALGNVIMPRASYLYHNGENAKQKANQLVVVSFRAVLLIAVPCAFGVAAIAQEFVPFFFGKGYEKSADILVILCFNVLVIAATNLLGQQCLIARQRQGEYNKAIVASAIVNVVMNYFVIQYMQSIGAAIASVLASLVSFSIIVYMSRKEIELSLLFESTWKCFIAGVIMAILVKVSTSIWYGTFKGIALHVIIGGLSYLIMLVCFREKFLTLLFKMKSKEKGNVS